MRASTLVLVLFAALLAGCPPSHTGAAIDRGHLFPLIVAAGDVARGASLVKSLGLEGLQVTLVTDVSTGKQGSMLVGVTREDLVASQLSEDDAWRIALDNLTAVAHSGVVQMQLLTSEDGKKKMAVFSGDWRAASCLLVPGLREAAAQQLGSNQLVALIPHQDSLVIFADEGPADIKATTEFVVTKERSTAKAITARPLRWLPAANKRFYEASLFAYADR